jgi:hypothetical protein
MSASHPMPTSERMPPECMRRPIENRPRPGQAVHEPFSGLGPIGVAAETSGRCCHAVGLGPASAGVAIPRWRAIAGTKAVLAGDGRSFGAVAAERRPAATD